MNVGMTSHFQTMGGLGPKGVEMFRVLHSSGRNNTTTTQSINPFIYTYATHQHHTHTQAPNPLGTQGHKQASS